MESDLGRAFDASPALVWIARPDGRIDFANRRWSDYTGFSLDAAQGWDWQAAINPVDLPTMLERWRSILATGEPGEMEGRVRRFDGQYRWFLLQCSPMCDDTGQIIKWCGLGSDIDDLRRAEDAVRRHELDYQLIVDSIPVPVAVMTPSGGIECVNRLTLDYFGKSLEELRGWKAADVVHPDDLEETIAAQLDAQLKGNPYNFESRHRLADGPYRWFNVLGLPLRDPQGNILRWLRLLIDIDDRKRAEESLRDSQPSSRLILDGIPGLVATFTPDGEVEFVNRQVLEYFGKTLEDLKLWESSDATHPDDLPRVVALFVRSIASGEPFEFEVRARRFDGVYRWFQSRGFPLRDKGGRILRWYNLLIDIDERKRAEEALAAREREARLIVDSIPGGVEVLSPGGEVEAVNEHVATYFGKTAEELKRTGLNGLIHPKDLQNALDTALRSTTTGEPYDTEMRLLGADGTYRWFHIRGLPLRDASGRIARWYALHIDVDGRKRAEEALRESERKFKLIIDTIPALVWSARPDGSAEFFSQHYLDYAGLSAEQAQGWGWTVAVHPDDLSGLAATWQAIMASGKQGEAEARLRRFDGEYRWLLFRTSPLRDTSGNIVNWYGVNTDIDDRKRAETNLAREKHLLEMIASGSPVRDILGALCIMVEEAGPGCYCDVHPIERSGPSIEYSVAPSLPASYTDPIAGLSLAGDALPCALAVRHKVQVVAEDIDTDPRWRDSDVRTHVLEHGLRSVWSTPIYAKDGGVLGTLCLYHRQPTSPSPQHQSLIAHATHLASIAIERSRTEAALRRSEAFLAEGQHLARMGNFSWHVATGEITWSEQLYRIFEFDPGDLLTFELIATRVHPEDMPLMADMVERATRGESDFEYQHRIVLPDHSIKHLHLIAHRSRDDPGQMEYIGAVLDVSQRRRAEEALSKARSDLAHVSRATSLGAMTASIAHEVNQPLSGIITNASTCLRMLATDPPNIEVARETARRTIRDGNRAADVIARLRALFSRRAITIEPVDLNEAAREVIALAWSDLQRSRVVLRTELADPLPLVAGDRVQLQQVLMNLLRNAADAMSNVEDRPRLLVIRTQPDAADHVRLSVQDAGIGLAPHRIDQVFEPFFTTKSDGMGIGLSVSRSIIEGHSGQMWAQENVGPGVTFSFSIPRYSGDEKPLHGAGAMHAPVAGNAQSPAGIP